MSLQVAIGLSLLLLWMLSFFFSVRLSPVRPGDGRRWSAFELLMLGQIVAILVGGGVVIYAVLR